MKWKRKKSDLLIDSPIDLLSLLIAIAGMLTLFLLRVIYTGSEEFPNMESETMSLLIKGFIGLSVMLAFRVLIGKKETDLFGFVKTKIEFWGYAIACYFAIQIIVIILGEAVFQVSEGAVYAFFISAAIMEELLYRGALVMIVQYISARVLETHKYPLLWGSTIFSAIISGLIFMAVHTRYWGDPISMAITFLGGVSQAIWYQYTKNLSVPMLAHMLINFVASGSLLQTLG